MRKSKAARIAGFTVALGATASLVGFAATGTGAYFTDSHDGTVHATAGSVKVQSGTTHLHYTNLLPGEYQTDSVGYQVTGTGPEDIWLVFPPGPNQLSDTGGGASLGRYGHFAVHSTSGDFVSNNLASAGTGDHSGDTCSEDAYGHGGSNTEATTQADHTVPFCPIPNAILLDSNLTQGATGSADVTFGFTKIMKDQSQPNIDAQFQLVATQHGILPSDPNN